jgi:transcriptional regulator with XRE-family HTH domain
LTNAKTERIFSPREDDIEMVKMRARRLELGYSQQTLAYRARVANSDISKFENQRQVPYPSQAKRVARVLGLQPEELLVPVGTETAGQSRG